MLKNHSAFIKQLTAGLDCLLILNAFYASYYYFSHISKFIPFINYIMSYWVMLVGFSFFYLYFAETRSLFSILQFSWVKGLLLRTVKVFCYSAVLGAAFLYLMPIHNVNPRLYLSFVFFSFLLIAFEKIIIKRITVKLRSSSYKTTPIMVMGRGRAASQICQEIDNHPEWGLRVICKMDVSTSVKEFENLIKNSYVEEIFFCFPRKISGINFLVDPYIKACEEMGRPARVFFNMPSVTNSARWDYHHFMGRPSLVSHTIELDPDQLVFKRIFDVAGAVFGIFLLAAFYLPFAVLIKTTSRGPVFFKQVRVGKSGKHFVMHKFRSMHCGAEVKREELENENECKGAIFKIKDDPRVTFIGKIMRKFSFDELPQFLDVLKGDMSLVGTRPPTTEEVEKYQKWHHRRISIKPGMTGQWQVSGRNKITDFDEIAKLDLKYIDNWSIWLDIKIICKTVFVIFKRDSAY
ncbi:MAG: sugar transferase [Chitinispirillales bacterium]|jgi:exopolysaccharide biosynthesis polyprenyl glycosylphosphotransferase|nr:sugar transferase [Chitinispirillales bacterium]